MFDQPTYEKVEKEIIDTLIRIQNTHLKGAPIIVSSSVLVTALASGMARVNCAFATVSKADINTVIKTSKDLVEDTTRRLHEQNKNVDIRAGTETSAKEQKGNI